MRTQTCCQWNALECDTHEQTRTPNKQIKKKLERNILDIDPSFVDLLIAVKVEPPMIEIQYQNTDENKGPHIENLCLFHFK